MFVREIIKNCILCVGLLNAPNILAQDNVDKLTTLPRLSGDVRMRFQNLVRDDFFQDANAFTLRFSGAAEFDIFRKTTLLGEVEGNILIVDEFNSGSNGRNQFPLISDPKGVALNRLQIITEVVPDTRLTLGRQKIALDDWRFIGTFPFRQNDQTIDAFRLETKAIGPGILDLGYFNKVHRPSGSDNLRGTFEGDSYYANYNVGTPLGRVSAFHYSLGLESGPEGDLRQDMSTSSTGIRILGRRDGDQLSFGWEASYANQKNSGGNSIDYNADYWLVEFTIKPSRFTMKSRIEILGSDNGVSFQTPLASLHRFNGFADQFLQTPEDGLRDYSISMGYNFGDFGPFKRINAFARHHWFEANNHNRRYGTELDLSLKAKFQNLDLAIEYASFNSVTFSSDNKAMFLSTSFPF